MAKQTIESAVDVYWVDNKDELNANFTELYAAAGVATTAKAAEINTLDSVVNHLVGTYTPAIGTCAVDFQLYEAGASADAIAEVRAGFGYISDSLGGLGTAITSVATLSKGTISTLVTGSVFFWVCNSSGHIDMTLTGSAGTKYVTLVFPNGKIMRSEACIIN
jgi:hypothetical protein